MPSCVARWCPGLERSILKERHRRRTARRLLADRCTEGWAKLLKRVFNLDLEHCPNCDGELKVIAAILERPAIENILSHVGLDARPPPRSPARGQRLSSSLLTQKSYSIA
jgi:hypothetical protein